MEATGVHCLTCLMIDGIIPSQVSSFVEVTISDTRTSCLSFTDGQWITSHQLQYNRSSHLSWMSQHGVVLMGGDSLTTTEILTDNGGSTPAFTLKYNT